MFEKEFEEALHLEQYTLRRLKVAYEREKESCETDCKDSNLVESKSYTLLEIATMTRDLHTKQKEQLMKLSDRDLWDIDNIISKSENSNEVLSLLKKEYFNSNYSKPYLIRFTKTVLHYLYLNNQGTALQQFKVYFSELDCNSISLVLHVTELLTKKDDSIKTFDPYLNYILDKETRELVLKKRYLIEDIEILQLIMEMTALSLVLSKQAMEDPYLTASYYVYKNIAKEYRTHDRAPEGIVFAKEGLFIQNIFDKAKAIDELGSCAIDSYGKLQLAHDVYYSWLFNDAVGEFAELYKDYDANSLLPSQYELNEWLSNKSNAEKVSNFYNNLTYICGEISETYDKREVRRRVFLDHAYEYTNKSIKFSNSSTYYLNRSILQYRIGLLYDLPEKFAKNRLSSSLTSARKHLYLVENDDNKHIKTTIESFKAESVYSETLLDWLLEAFQIFMKDNYNRLHDQDCASTYLDVYRDFYNNKKIVKEIDDFFKTFFRMKESSVLMTSSKMKTKSHSELIEKDKWEPFFSLCDFSISDEKTDDKLKEWLLLLLLFDNSTKNLKFQLKRQNYSSTNYFLRSSEVDKDIKKTRDEICPIAYYTTLSNIKFLFDAMTETQALGSADEIIKSIKTNGEKQGCEKPSESNKENKKNCLTLMHVRHMNDPLEGLMLLRILFQEMEAKLSNKLHPFFSELTPEIYREQIYDQNYVFLKAFTERLDKLDMWNRYASDRTSGKDSNGCCVQLNPETFSRQDKDTEQRMKKQFNMQDDFKLYKVLYLSDKGEIAGQEDTNVILYYETFKKLFVTLNEYLCDEELSEYYGNKWDDFVKKVARITESIIMNIMFLFKPEDYAGEKESRIVIIRSSDQKSSFHLVNSTTPRVYITPFHQVYVDKITLGPKTESPDHWMPYLQYKIDGMRQVIQEDLDEGTRISYFPEKISVRKSTIPYQD